MDAAEKEIKNRRSQLRKWIESRHGDRPGNQAAFVAAHGLNQGEISSLLRDKSFGSRKARTLEKQAGMPFRYLEEMSDPPNEGRHLVPPPNTVQARTGHVQLPVLDVSPAAGAGGEPIDHPVVLDYMEFPEIWAHHKLGRDLSKYRLLPVSGDSMSPTINDGDLAFVDTSIQGFDSEGIYVIIWNDRLLIKRLRAVLATQRIEIRSDNSDAYGAETVSMDELARLHICGLVRCWWSIKGA